jgi:hypothetical protein
LPGDEFTNWIIAIKPNLRRPLDARFCEIALVILHLSGMLFERRIHENNGAHIDRFASECHDNREDLPGTAGGFHAG